MSTIASVPFPSLRRAARVRRLVLLVALLPLLALTACHQAFGTAPHGGPASGPGQATLTNVRAGTHPTFDRVVFDFAGPVPNYQVEYVPRSALVAPSGQVVPIRGNFFLRVRFEPAVVRSSTPSTVTPLFREVRQIKRVEAFEGVVVYGVGVTSRNAFRVFSLSAPNRVVLDVRN
jgi:hypothetical protein